MKRHELESHPSFQEAEKFLLDVLANTETPGECEVLITSFLEEENNRMACLVVANRKHKNNPEVVRLTNMLKDYALKKFGSQKS